MRAAAVLLVLGAGCEALQPPRVGAGPRRAPAVAATTATEAVLDQLEVGAAPLDWEELGFTYRPTRCHVQYTYKNGAWDAGELVDEPYLKIHIGATALHYGQAAFEGLKAFAQKDGSVKIFRPFENAARMQRSAQRSLMAEVPDEVFIEGVRRAVAANKDFIPPYGAGGSLYVRPLLVGSGARIGLQPADEYTFIVLVVPVGAYYKGSGPTPVSAVVIDDYDRAAPKGVGSVKVAGNYVADLLPSVLGKKRGFPIGLYLDAETRQYVEEFSTSNFFGITKDGTYVTPLSDAVLPSITNKSLMTVAEAAGIKVERRRVKLAEVFDGSLTEVAACGTAVVVTPIKQLVQGDRLVSIGDGETVGPKTLMLYDTIRAIQIGDLPDPYGWMVSL
ncbi:branched-chain amino acid aminotransferase [Pelagophyceae sp. CCMP2097]|nr:branched-chain amino acid aminotransferase [Pelagophyceae sp. CCMP2097]